MGRSHVTLHRCIIVLRIALLTAARRRRKLTLTHSKGKARRIAKGMANRYKGAATAPRQNRLDAPIATVYSEPMKTGIVDS